MKCNSQLFDCDVFKSSPTLVYLLISLAPQPPYLFTHRMRLGASLVVQMVKNPPAMQETWVLYLDWEDPLEEGMETPFQYSCLENPHAQRSLASKSLWGHRESDMTEQLSTHMYFYVNTHPIGSLSLKDPEKHSSHNILFKPGRSISLAPLL